MCGIVGYIGDKEKIKFLLDGLKELEYRGYDSSGIATFKDGQMNAYKATGKLENLRNKLNNVTSEGFGVGIAHTRWATHGKPTECNAHPHWGEFSFVIHNGIIENYKEIKELLEAKGKNFLSQTDTEIIVHLFEHNLELYKEPFLAFEKVVEQIKGAYAIQLITKSEPDKIFFAKNCAPLIIGKSSLKELYFASSDTPLVGFASSACYLEDGDYGVASVDEIVVKNGQKQTSLNFIAMPTNKEYAQKDGYRYFMEKEIYEQAEVLTQTLMGRLGPKGVELDEINDSLLEGINSIKICACGTSYHAGIVATYLFERLSKVHATIEIASEFRYKEPLLTTDTLFVVISQSGETADTLEALKMAKNAGLKTLAICNVDNSSIVRLSDSVVLTRAGIEKGVASTKAFATQVATLWMIALHVANKKKSITTQKYEDEIKALSSLPKVLHVKSSMHEKLHRLSKRYLHGHGFFFIGRDIFYPLALEGALKLKEISYLHAEGYPAGEMKHGPIALADSELFTVALLPQTLLYEKTKSNVEELCARDATTLAISPLPFELADDFIQTSPYTHPMQEFFEMMVITQIFALEVAIRLGNDVDMPRNLAKSVTVE